MHKSKRSTVSATDESTDDEGSETSGSEEEPDTRSQKVPETTAHAESAILEHRRRKLEIREGKGKTGKGKDEKRHYNNDQTTCLTIAGLTKKVEITTAGNHQRTEAQNSKHHQTNLVTGQN